LISERHIPHSSLCLPGLRNNNRFARTGITTGLMMTQILQTRALKVYRKAFIDKIEDRFIDLDREDGTERPHRQIYRLR